jgi:hypothetical protein
MTQATVTKFSQLAADTELGLTTRTLTIDLIEKYLQYRFSNAPDFFVAGVRCRLPDSFRGGASGRRT